MQKLWTFEKKKELNVQLQTWDRQFDIFVLRDPPKEMSIAWSWIDPDSRVARELFLESYTERLIQSLQLRRGLTIRFLLFLPFPTVPFVR